jgi:putative ribosome biogenesis GTPase RsgA
MNILKKLLDKLLNNSNSLERKRVLVISKIDELLKHPEKKYMIDINKITTSDKISISLDSTLGKGELPYLFREEITKK